MYSLFLDTHDKDVIVILYKDGKVFCKVIKESLNRHSEILVPTINQVLTDNNLKVNDLSLILVVNGPGSFTGARLAVTVAKTMAYCLNIPIKVIDSLTIKAINIDGEIKIVSLPDRNGAFIGKFDINNKLLEDFKYISKSDYELLKNNNKVYSDVLIDYDKVYNYMEKLEVIKSHEVKPIYIKGISALNDKKS